MNKYHFDKQTEELLFQKSLPNILLNAAQFEDIRLTLSQIEQLLIDPSSIEKPQSDMKPLENVYRGAQYILTTYQTFDFDNLKELHQIVAQNEVQRAGHVRINSGGVNTKRGLFVPNLVDELAAKAYFDDLMSITNDSAQTNAIKTFTYLSRSQLFDDANKRTALLAANVPLLKAGAGVFYIAESSMDNVLTLMSDFYHSNNSRLLHAVLEDIAVTDYDGHTFYTDSHQSLEYAAAYHKHLNTFKGLGPKGILGKEKVKLLVNQYR